MKTLVFATGWGDSSVALELRLGRWIRHHAALPWPCEVVIGAALDGIPEDRIIWDPPPEALVLNHMPHLGRPEHLSYPGWWRSFASGLWLARSVGAERIFHVESDFFVASPRMLENMHAVVDGWQAYWCPRHSFPETGIQVIAGEGCFALLEAIGKRLEATDYACYNGRHAEHVLPFDRVEQSLTGDRYGEAGIDPRTIAGLDYYGQLGEAFEPVFA